MAPQVPKPPQGVPQPPRFDIPAETRARLIQRSYLRLIVDMAIAFTEKYGEDAWQILEKIAYNIGQERAARLKERFKIDTTDCRSLVDILAFEMAVFAPSKPEEYQFLELTEKRKVARVYSCAQAGELQRCPDLCMRFFDYVDQGTYDALGVKVKVSDCPKRLTKGDPYCEAILEIEP